MVEGRETGIDQLGPLQLKDPGKIRDEYMNMGKGFQSYPNKKIDASFDALIEEYRQFNRGPLKGSGKISG